MKYVVRAYRLLFSSMLSMPAILKFTLHPAVGRHYGIGPLRKLGLLIRFWNNTRHVSTLSDVREHMELAEAILRVPPSVRGDVIECGCYVGGSSVNLSLVCAMVGRRLVICDSFAGLPEPGEHDREHLAIHVGHVDTYFKGRFAAAIDVVKANLAARGKLEVCDFHAGFFDQSMSSLNRDAVLAFLDVDLIDSLKPCLLGIWPRLPDGCRIYVHEARNFALVSLFFNPGWWRENLDEEAPGFVGSGVGLPLGMAINWGSELGYAQKCAAPARRDLSAAPAPARAAAHDSGLAGAHG